MKWMSLILLFSLLALGCQNSADAGGAGDTGDSGGTKQPTPDDLPQPALDTVEMSLNGTRYTLTNKANGCIPGNPGDIGFSMPGFTSPTLFIHDADLNAQGNVTVRGGAGAWHMDIDAVTPGGAWLPAGTGCTATVMENTATIFELKTSGCNILQGGVTTGKVSFRVRCRK